MTSVRATVVGAGVVGAAVAYRLALAGAAVQVVEQDRPGAGATGTTFARLSAFAKQPAAYFALNHEGIREHARLAGELGEPAWYHPCGSYLWADPADGQQAEDLERQADQARQQGYPLDRLDRAEAARRFGDAVQVPAAADPVLHATAEGWVDAVGLARRLLAEAGRLGAELRTGDQVAGLRPADAGGWHVTLRSGGSIAADAVVNAAGGGAQAVAALAGSALSLTPSHGLLLRLAAGAGDPVRHILHLTHVSIRPDGPGGAMVRSDQVDRQLAESGEPVGPAVLDRLCRDLQARAGGVVPALEEAAVAGRQVGERVMPLGGYPSVGGVSDLPGYYEAVSHSGVILAPLFGRLLTEEILTGRVHELLAPYRPVSLAGRGSAARA